MDIEFLYYLDKNLIRENMQIKSKLNTKIVYNKA